jgi:hypothetical protein
LVMSSLLTLILLRFVPVVSSFFFGIAVPPQKNARANLSSRTITLLVTDWSTVIARGRANLLIAFCPGRSRVQRGSRADTFSNTTTFSGRACPLTQ